MCQKVAKVAVAVLLSVCHLFFFSFLNPRKLKCFHTSHLIRWSVRIFTLGPNPPLGPSATVLHY